MTTATSIDIPTEREDPMPAGMLGMWLFLAGEAMFFAGLLSAYIVLQSTGEQHELFARSARVVSLPLTLVSIAILGASTIMVWRRSPAWAVAGAAIAFLLVQGVACGLLLSHRTIVTDGNVYDGRWTLGRSLFYGSSMPIPTTLDLARLTPGGVPGPVGNQDVHLGGQPRANEGYGPSRNNYFACYFLVTTAHAIHVIGGLLAMAWLAMRRRSITGVQRRAVSLYWQFVNGVGILSLVLLALG